MMTMMMMMKVLMLINPKIVETNPENLIQMMKMKFDIFNFNYYYYN